MARSLSLIPFAYGKKLGPGLSTPKCENHIPIHWGNIGPSY